MDVINASILAKWNKILRSLMMTGIFSYLVVFVNSNPKEGWRHWRWAPTVVKYHVVDFQQDLVVDHAKDGIDYSYNTF